MPASAAPPAAYQGLPPLACRLAWVQAPSAVVETVNVAVPLPVPLMATDPVEPKPTVGASEAFAGLEVITAVKATVPVKPPAGVTVIVDALPAVAPGVTATVVPVMEKLGGIGAVTVTRTVPVAAVKCASPA